ncbi:uncharacterized protein N7459_008887 [Penicillium hispanicum]|uniref:uncharacterized protein n=1 Tax=Penicillium hispanicum TaxID=1080232 RepID=UPI0025406395|nr:uncharacterized protein N7459_008887 [Penicillium hispanicum]KAJ5569457.1 hypothetical protein N7459_008887 [Penicillium hispanicum]
MHPLRPDLFHEKSIATARGIADALRRHYKSCSQIGIQPEPAPGRPGRRRKACDNCARNRIACDGNSVCGACEQNGNTCSYQRLGAPPSGLPGPPLNVQRIAIRSYGERRTTHQDSQNQSKVSVPFLLNYSAASSQSPGDVNHVLSLLSTAESKDQNLEPALPSFEVEADRADLFFEDSWGILFGSLRNDGQPQNSSLPGGLDDPDKRQAGADRIIQCLSSVFSDHPDLCVGFDIDRARDFIQEENVHALIMAYFEETVRPRSRIVLKSSFDLDLVSAPLLLSMLLMGAICGTSERVKSQAADYVEMAELAVFEDPSFLQLIYKSSDFDPKTLSDGSESNDIQL